MSRTNRATNAPQTTRNQRSARDRKEKCHTDTKQRWPQNVIPPWQDRHTARFGITALDSSPGLRNPNRRHSADQPAIHWHCFREPLSFPWLLHFQPMVGNEASSTIGVPGEAQEFALAKLPKGLQRSGDFSGLVATRDMRTRSSLLPGFRHNQSAAMEVATGSRSNAALFPPLRSELASRFPNK